MKPFHPTVAVLLTIAALYNGNLHAQYSDADSSWKNSRKNIVRYNLSGGLLFGIDKYVVFGYERVIKPHQSLSLNVGRAALPKLVSINTDSFSVSKDLKNTGFNISLDYRFYLAKENKYVAPHGLYIGPYIAYNNFKRDNNWTFKKGTAQAKEVSTATDINIFTVGGELGYQFILWKRLALDLVLIGPGLSRYDLSGKIDGELTEEQKEKLRDVMTQVISQKFPGMNYVFADKSFDANGTLNTTSIGFRYMVHIGFVF